MSPVLFPDWFSSSLTRASTTNGECTDNELQALLTLVSLPAAGVQLHFITALVFSVSKQQTAELKLHPGVHGVH